jgi:hypothetical protein
VGTSASGAEGGSLERLGVPTLPLNGNSVDCFRSSVGVCDSDIDLYRACNVGRALTARMTHFRGERYGHAAELRARL